LRTTDARASTNKSEISWELERKIEKEREKEREFRKREV